MEKLVSIIIPVYNHAHSLGRCLLSIHAQTYRPIEVIIVNDGSKDNFKEVIQGILNQDWIKDLPVKVVEQENKGACAARNRGFKDAEGEYVIFWDADTLGRPEMLRSMIATLEKNPEAAYAYSQYDFGFKKMKGQDFDPEELQKYNYIDTTSLIRRGALSNSPFDESLKRFQDWDVWLTLLKGRKFGVFIPEVLYKKEVGNRVGISSWVPSFVYKLPLKTKKVSDYFSAREIILKKHNLSG